MGVRSLCFVGCNPTRYLILPKKTHKVCRGIEFKDCICTEIRKIYSETTNPELSRIFTTNQIVCDKKKTQKTNNYKDKARETCFKIGQKIRENSDS